MVSPDLLVLKSSPSNRLSLADERIRRTIETHCSTKLLSPEFLLALYCGDIPITVVREIEATYFVPREATLPLVRAHSVERADISQAYFTKETRNDLLQELFLASDSRVFSTLLTEVKSARVRKIERGSCITYGLDLKGAKQGPEDARVARTEISIPLDKVTYRRLQGNATRGGIEKTRYFVDGAVEPKGREEVSVRAEIDHFERIGTFKNGRPRDVIFPSLDFALVDIELPNRALLRTLRAGRHSFDFLENAIDVALLPPHLQKQFSAQRLASQGITDDMVNAIRKVVKKIEKQAA